MKLVPRLLRSLSSLCLISKTLTPTSFLTTPHPRYDENCGQHKMDDGASRTDMEIFAGVVKRIEGIFLISLNTSRSHPQRQPKSERPQRTSTPKYGMEDMNRKPRPKQKSMEKIASTAREDTLLNRPKQRHLHLQKEAPSQLYALR
jgi:hypothetical protein